MENKKIFVVYIDKNESLISQYCDIEIDMAFNSVDKANKYIIDQLVNYQLIPQKYIFIKEIELEEV
jgi:hypothetical protein